MHHTCADHTKPPLTNSTFPKKPPLPHVAPPRQLFPAQGHLFTLFSHFSAACFVFQFVDKPPGHGIVAMTTPQIW